MKRSDLIRTLQVQFKRMRQNDAAAMVDSLADFFAKSLAEQNRIEIRGFGTFEVRKHSARVGFNPQNGQAISLEPCKTVLFRPSRELINKMNEN